MADISKNVLKHILRGCLSDPPGVSMYYNISRDLQALPLYHTFRGTSKNENFHLMLNEVLRAFNTSPELTNALAANFVHRYNTASAIHHLHRESTLAVHDVALLDEAYAATKEAFGEAGPLSSHFPTIYFTEEELRDHGLGFGCVRSDPPLRGGEALADPEVAARAGAAAGDAVADQQPGPQQPSTTGHPQAGPAGPASGPASPPLAASLPRRASLAAVDPDLSGVAASVVLGDHGRFVPGFSSGARNGCGLHSVLQAVGAVPRLLSEASALGPLLANHWTVVADLLGQARPYLNNDSDVLNYEFIEKFYGAWRGSTITVDGVVVAFGGDMGGFENFEKEMLSHLTDQAAFWGPTPSGGLGRDLSTDSPAGFIILALITGRKIVVVSAATGFVDVLGGPELPDADPVYLLHTGHTHYVPLWAAPLPAHRPQLQPQASPRAAAPIRTAGGNLEGEGAGAVVAQADGDGGGGDLSFRRGPREGADDDAPDAFDVEAEPFLRHFTQAAAASAAALLRTPGFNSAGFISTARCSSGASLAGKDGIPYGKPSTPQEMDIIRRIYASCSVKSGAGVAAPRVGSINNALLEAAYNIEVAQWWASPPSVSQLARRLWPKKATLQCVARARGVVFADAGLRECSLFLFSA